MLKDFINYLKNRKDIAYPSNQLYFGSLANFDVTTKNGHIHSSRTMNGYFFMRELTPKEKRKYIHQNYGSYISDLPEYIRYNHENIRFFYVFTLNKVIPELSHNDVMMMDHGYVESVCNPVPVASLNKKNNIPEYISKGQMQELETSCNINNPSM